MENSDNYFPVLEEILKDRDFKRLEMFNDELIEKLTSKEKTLFSFILVLQGEELIELSEVTALELFDRAVKHCSHLPEVHYHVGLVLFKSGQKRSSTSQLKIACQKFRYCLQLDPLHVHAAKQLGLCLAWYGFIAHEPKCFQDSEDCFESIEKTVISLSGNDPFHFYATWAAANYLHGRFSGEVVDYRKSCDKYQKALEFDKGYTQFWNEYGHSVLAMALLMGSEDLFLQAATLYELSVQESPKDYKSLFYLGTAYHELFDITAKEDHYIRALTAYEEASLYDDEDVELRIRFGNLLVGYGKLWHDQDAIEASIEKFKEDEGLQGVHPLIYKGWAEALILLGMYREDLSLLMQAKEKIVKALEVSPEHADIWGCYGQCLYELGKYFQDENYFRQALQKFQYGLALDDRKSSLWFGLSRVELQIAEMKKDEVSALKAVEAASKSVSLRKMQPLYWSNWAVCLLQLAEILENRQYIEAAIDKLQSALSLLDKDEEHYLYLETLYHYGYALDFLGDFDLENAPYQKAIQILMHVVEKEPSYFQARYTLASALLHLGELSDDVNVLQEALVHFQILADEDPEDYVVIADFGVAYLNLAYLTKDTGRPQAEEYFLTQAEEKLSLSASLGGSHSYYYLACLFSMKGQFDVAMHFIEKAELFAVLPSLDDLLNDEWLEALKNTAQFAQFIHRLKTRNISES
jgi:tetratricopeptide (TPR) repeat protein